MPKDWKIGLLVLLFFVALPAWAVRRADHVFIISFDGGKPAVMKESKMPELMSLLKHSAYTWDAQTVFPSITLTAHTSMLTGVGPDQHHALWNEWEPEKGLIKVPTIFALAKQQNLTTAMFVSKPKFLHLFVPGTLNMFALPSYKSKYVAEVAADYIKDKKPNLCFIHFTDSDSAGHAFGWGSKQQIQSFADEDDSLKVVMKAIEDAGIEHNSVVILTADHGGHEHTHGSKMPEDMTIPWIAWGDAAQQDFQIKAPVTTCDTAATALWLLDVPMPGNFDGKPVTSAFSEAPATKSATTESVSSHH
jgi:predicted AlkP superfamily pyrophosphatase or phosphodiesterase